MNTKPRRVARFTTLALGLILAVWSARAADMYVYFGTHASGPGKGFSLAHFDTDTGKLTEPKFLIEDTMPAYFVIAPDGRHLYTCNSTNTLRGEGWISAYAIDPKTGQLTLLNREDSGGANPSYICLDKTGRFALVANYQGGNVTVTAINPDGSFGDRIAYNQHTGRSVNPQRQTRPYAHSIIVDPSNRFALSADLGADKLYVYRFDDRDGSLTPNKPPFVRVKPGSGPRHVRFHPNGRWVYLINEMASTVTGFNWNGKKGMLKEFQTISTLPSGYKGVNTAAELQIHPNGRFLYASNRGDDSLAVFAINQKTGKLTSVEHVSTQGKMPRNFTFDPTGRWILCTNHDSNNAVVFRVDGATGKLTPVGSPIEVPLPFCERFLPVPKTKS
ncbi:MAG TPA: lactonase family protein [Verrucomicrobiae bacterium]|nr:lactonase family protein [Verrucomicrobiae bacterium]